MSKITIHRTRIGKDIVAEFAVPPSLKAQQQGRVVVLCQGAPTMPGKSGLMDFLARKGFYVVLPRYRGSWESGGTFLAKEPTEDIREVIDALKTPFVSLWEGKKYSFPKKLQISIIASSFGGPACFLLSKDSRIHKVVALSPVCDWREQAKGKPYDLKYDFVKKVYGEGYRIAKNGWVRLSKGNFYNPMNDIDSVDGGKTLIFHARNDTSVPFHSVFDFAYVTGATLKASLTGGHMGLSEAMEPATWHEIARWLK